MSYYGMLWPSYFDGPTGREIVKCGGPAAQSCGAYLTSAHEANMIGLYRIPIAILKVRLGWKQTRHVEQALCALGTAGFADYDRLSEYVWVRQMAYYRLGLEDGPLDAKDNRVGFVQRLYADAEPNPFLPPFFARYHKELHLRKERTHPGPIALMRLPIANPLVAATDRYMSGLQGAYQAPPKPVTESVSVTEPVPVTGTCGSSALAKTLNAEPPAAAGVFNFPVVGPGLKTWTLTADYLAQLSEHYPNLDVLAECRRGLAWCEANVTQRKTASGMPRFLVNWLNKATSSGHGRAYAGRINSRPLHTPVESNKYAGITQGDDDV